MREFIAITKALADESRVRMLMALTQGELCLCQLIEMLGLAPSTVSKHMSILTRAGLTKCRKAGRWRYYRLADNKPGVEQEIQATLDWVKAMTRNSPVLSDDRKRLQCISSKEIEEVSACYRG